MNGFLELAIDKFIFRVATDRLYDEQGLWLLLEDAGVRIGFSDFLQQRSGDIAFAEVKPVGTVLAKGDEMGSVETIKVNLAIASPVAGRVVDTNPLMDSEPERINTDPYGEGWVAVVEVEDWVADQAALLPPEVFLETMRQQAQHELDA